MTTPFARGMARATELTRAGKLDEATALIQSLLQGQTAAEAAPADDDVIEGDFVTIENAGGAQPPPADKATKSKSAKGLREKLRGMASGNFTGPQLRPVVEPELPHGAQFLSLTHRGAQGSRDYRLYIPANQAAEPMPLVVMLHGCTQSPEDFAIGTGMNALAEEFGCLIAYPAQTQAANAQKCWNWFRPEDQRRDRGEPALIAGIVRDILRDQPADRTRVYVAGLSAGGAAAAILGAAYPDIFAAVGVHSGLPVGSANDMPSAFAAMRGGSTGLASSSPVPTIVFHGLADSTVHPGNGAAVVAQVARRELRQQQTTGRAGSGRSYRRTDHRDAEGRNIVEHWEIEGAGHAWAGGHTGGSFTDPSGPDASREMLRFFLQHRQAGDAG